VLLPTEDTHGEHKAASILALEAIEQLPSDQTPAILGAVAGAKDPAPYKGLPGYPNTAANSATPQFQFDRDISFAFRNSLSYQIVVSWVISEHKSQGLFQTMYGQDRFENFWVFALNGDSKTKRAAAFFDEILPKSSAVGSTVEAGKTK
jgi:N-acetylglucosamine malate deacetylase 2